MSKEVRTELTLIKGGTNTHTLTQDLQDTVLEILLYSKENLEEM